MATPFERPKFEKLEKFKKYFSRRKPTIQEVVRETTAGGIVFRKHKGEVQILLTQDAKDRWTIAKGHVEEGEVTRETAEREIQEETGLKQMRVLDWLGKINFRYRRQNSLVLMTMHVYLVHAQGDTEALKKEEWMNGIGWFNVADSLDKIEYEDIGKLILLAMKKIRQGNY